MDTLADILKAARLSGGVFFRAEFSAPWCLGGCLTPEMCAPFIGTAQHLVPYHYLVSAEVVVSVNGGPAQTLRSGDVGLCVGVKDVRVPGLTVPMRSHQD